MKLRNLKPALGALAPRLKRQTDAEGHDRVADPWRAWYSLKRWRQLRWATLVRDLFTCQEPECGRLEPRPSLLVADHKVAHRGNPDLFWNQDNLQTLCKTCHDARKQREERAAAWPAGRGGGSKV